MLFHARQRRSWLRSAREILWPSIGWRRAICYFMHRLGRLSDTPAQIAGGLAFGAAVSFTPFFGFHIFIACLLTRAMRGNLWAAVAGTAVGNPWTFPFIALFSCQVGSRITGRSAPHLDQLLVWGNKGESLWKQYLEQFLSWSVGGILLGTAVWIGVFLAMKRVISLYQLRRKAHRLRKLRRRVVRLASHDPGLVGGATFAASETKGRLPDLGSDSVFKGDQFRKGAGS